MGLRIVVGILFVYAGVSKISAPHQFALDISSFRLVPSFAVMPLVWSLPFVEIACGIMIVLKRFHIAALTVVLFLMGLFLGALTWAYTRGLHVGCGCFGPRIDQDTCVWLIARDLFIAVVVFAVAIQEIKQHQALEAQAKEGV